MNLLITTNQCKSDTRLIFYFLLPPPPARIVAIRINIFTVSMYIDIALKKYNT